MSKRANNDDSKKASSPSDDTRKNQVVILRWNPYDKKDNGKLQWVDYENALQFVKNGFSWREDWNCSTTEVRKGDTVYIYKADGKKFGEKDEEAGIVARGTVISDRRVENGIGRIDFEIDSMVDYKKGQYLEVPEIKKLTKDGREADRFTTIQSSGFLLGEAFDEKKIADKWNDLLDDAMKDKKIWNLIRFGAPGTGKSYSINEEYKDVRWWKSKERVTFHPDYSYANFVGAYKPYMDGEKIVYKFVPGPFTRVLVNALRDNDPNGKHLLVIEEINRANTAAVFGDVFQLLDRGEAGESEYAISPSQDLAKFLRDALKQPKKNDDDWWWLTAEPLTDENVIKERIRHLKIPSNMYLWATMNSADQGVFPMDTAFKRRWSFEYVGINDGATEFTEGLPAQWDALRIAINEKLGELKVNEDKCMGPFFLAKKDLADLETFLKVFKSKVLMYLFEDAARQKRSSVFADELSTLSKIFAAVDKMRKGEDGSVFKDSLNEKLEKIINDSSAKDKGANSQGSDSSATEMTPSHEGSAEH